MTLGVFMMVLNSITVLRVTAPCILTCGYQYFIGTLHPTQYVFPRTLATNCKV